MKAPFSVIGDNPVDLKGDVAEDVTTAIEEEEVDMFCKAVGADECSPNPSGYY
jgi:hypothetical protein